jgi:hypothetical protein
MPIGGADASQHAGMQAFERMYYAEFARDLGAFLDAAD